MMDFLPVLALVAVVSGTWGWGWFQRRRLLRAVAEAAVRLGGRYEPGTHTSGGTLYGTYEGRDVVFTFLLSTTSRPESTTAAAVLKRPAREELLLRGRDAVARVPRLGAYTGWFDRVEVGVTMGQAWVKVPGVVRDAARLMELASVVTSLANSVDATP